MQGQAPGDAGVRVVRRERAWWQWVVGLGLLATAGAFAVVRYFPGLEGGQRRPFRPSEISISPKLRAADAVPAAPGSLAGSNLLLVTYDTTRADRIGCYGNRNIETPAIDRLASEGVLFSRALATAPTTLPSHSSIMTGLYPYRHGARANTAFRLGDENQTLAETLAANGYATGAAVSAVVLDAQFGIDQGFQEYDDHMDEVDEDDLDLRKIAQRKGDVTAALAEAWLRDHADQKFFLWLHLYDPHAPYKAPEAFQARHSLPYDAEIAFADSQLGRMMGVLDELGLTDDTLIVVAGDHGEGLGQHTELEHSSLIYDSTLRVPLVMRCGSKLGGGVHVDRWVSLVDTMPTVLSLLGIEAPADMDGIDLTQPAEGSRPIFSETLQGLADHGWAALLGVHEGDAKLIYGPWSEVYDLADDPFETDNLIDTESELAARLQGRLEEFFGADLEMAASADPTHQPSPEMIEALQSLGYLATGGGMTAGPAHRPHPMDMMPALTRMTAIISAEDEIGLDKVIAGLEQIAASNPDFATLYNHLGNALAKNGDLAGAEEAYARCLELRPADPQPLLALAGLKIRQREMDEAMTLFRQLVAQVPDHFQALYGLGKLLIAQGEYAEAIEMYKRALVVKPRDLYLPDMITDAVVVLSRGDDVVAFFQELLEKEPNLPMVRNALARLLAGRQEFEAAVTVLQDGIDLSPGQHELINNLAFMLATCTDPSIRRPVEAILMMERVCEETDYQDPRYMHTFSMVLAAMYRLDEAISVAERARRLATASDDARLTQLAPTIGISLQHFRTLKEQGRDASNAFNVPKEPVEATQGVAPVQPQIGRD